MKHTDFENTNEIWGWTDSHKFEKIQLNHAIAGDTDSIMLSVESLFPPDANPEEVVDIADGIAKITNESFPDFIQFAFNCPEDRKHSIQTDREVVSDKSIFLSKKRYIMNMVNSEGEWVDKLKIMGVELKKSDTPEIVKSMLTRLVNLMLEGKTMDDANALIKQMKEEYQDTPIQDLARPMSVKGLKKYYDMLEMTNDSKGFPYNVNAAMFYNSLCSTKDKKIVPGDKIGIVYIKHPKSKYIGFPIDLNELPEFVNELTIDYDTQWDKAYKKLVSYMSALGWDIASRKESKRKELFGF